MAYNWTGFYVGINGGYGFGRSEFNGTLPSGGFDVGGGLVGGTVGYNWQTGPLVFGLEGDIDWSGIRAAACCGGSLVRRPATTGSAPRAAASATPSTASCPTSPAAPRSATSKTSVAGVGEHQRHQCRLDASAAASKPRSPVRGPPRSNISMSISAAAPTRCWLPARSFTTNIVRGGINYRF